MQKYRVVLDNVSWRTNIPYFRIEKACCINGFSGWTNLSANNMTYRAEKAHSIVRQIIEGEREWVVIPCVVSEIRLK